MGVHRFGLILVYVLAAGMGAARADQAPAQCASLASGKIEGANLISAAVVAAKDALPEYCRVLGYVRPAINFELRLPVRDWNGKFYMAGCGGFCGTLDSDRPGHVNAANDGLRRGYAAVTTDGGHWGQSVLDGRWAQDNPVARADFAYRAVTETARVGKLLSAAYYGRAASKAYFNGCSNGGRQALMEASRFPQDFDGIIAGAPALDFAGGLAVLFPWVSQADADAAGMPIFRATKLGMLADAVAKKCGGPEGIVEDPRECRFDPAALQCTGQDQGSCLTSAEVSVVKKWYSAPIASDGRKLFIEGIPQGSESYWRPWLVEPGADRIFGREALRYVLAIKAPGERFDPVKDYDLGRDSARFQDEGAQLNATDPNLSAFRARGGKLIMYQGWADAIVTPLRTVAHYGAIEVANGGPAAARDFVRLFMVPGMDHCGISMAGPGVDQRGFDPLAALEAWVERGDAPKSILATKLAQDGKALWSRPICAYPGKAEFSEAGARDDPQNWTCR